MISVKQIMKKDFSTLPFSNNVGSAIEIMEKINVDYLLIEEEGEIKGMVTSREIVGYPSSRLLIDCTITPVSTISEETSLDKALELLEENKVNLLTVLNKEGIPNGVLNREIIISFLYQELKKTNEELKQEIIERRKAQEDSQLFQNLINQSYDAVFVIDPETSRFLYVNDMACSNLGYTREELLNMTFVDIEEGIPDNPSWKEHVKEAQKKGFMVLLGKQKRKDGTTFSVEVNAKPVNHEKRDYLITVARDITEREQMEELITRQLIELERFNSQLKSSRAFLTAILDSTIDAILTIDDNGRIRSVNKRTLELFGFEENELLNLNLNDFLSDFNIPEVKKSLSHKVGMGYLSALREVRALKKGGDEFDAEIAFREVSAPNLPEIGAEHRQTSSSPRFSVIVRDITERKQIEARKKEAREKKVRISQLERELRSLEQLSGFPKVSMTARAFGIKPLHESAPKIFNEQITDYNNLLDLSLEQRSYKVGYDISGELRTMANKLGFLKVGPREIINIHSAALKKKVIGVPSKKAQAYLEEGRLIVLELMGHLVSYYRSYSISSGSSLRSESQIKGDNKQKEVKL